MEMLDYVNIFSSMPIPTSASSKVLFAKLSKADLKSTKLKCKSIFFSIAKHDGSCIQSLTTYRNEHFKIHLAFICLTMKMARGTGTKTILRLSCFFYQVFHSVKKNS